jgi:hypothetical protein
MTSKLLINEPPLVVLPTLAKLIGLNEALLLQQIHYWISNTKIGIERDGHRWVHNTLDEWAEQFPFFHRNTIHRTLSSLCKKKVALKGKFNKIATDQTLWYTIDYDALNALVIAPAQQNGPDHQNGDLQITKLTTSLPETPDPKNPIHLVPPSAGTPAPEESKGSDAKQNRLPLDDEPADQPEDKPATKEEDEPIFRWICEKILAGDAALIAQDKKQVGHVRTMKGAVVRGIKYLLSMDPKKPLTDNLRTAEAYHLGSPKDSRTSNHFIPWYKRQCPNLALPRGDNFNTWVTKWYTWRKQNGQGITPAEAARIEKAAQNVQAAPDDDYVAPNLAT